jgi:diguanylate cyclase (GGDEF)-like protein
VKNLVNSNKINKIKDVFFKKEKSQTSTIELNNNKILNYYSSLAIYHPDIIIIFSSDAEIIFIDNNKIEKLTGFNISDKGNFQQIFPRETYQVLESAFTDTVGGEAKKIDIEIKTLKEESLFFALTFIPIKDEGKVEEVYLIANNMTDKVRLKKDLEVREKHLNHAQVLAEIGSWEYLIEEDQLICSDYFYYIFGLDIESSISMESPFQLVHPHDYEDAHAKVREAISNGTGYTNHFRIFHGKTKSIRYLKVHADVEFKENQPYKLIGVVSDETYKVLLENQIVEQNNNYKNVFDNLSSGIWIRQSIGGEFNFVSKGLEGILEIPLSKLYEDPGIWYKMIHPNYQQELSNGIKLLSKGESIQTIYQIISGNEKTKWLLEQVVPSVDSEGQVSNIFGLVIDVTNEMEIKDQLNYLSNYDSLTGLPNQKSLYERLDLLCDCNEPFAIFYLDIDRLSMINNSLGYHIGDEVLKFLTLRFEALLTNKGYLARLSSNDFIMIVQNYKNKKEIYQLADKIINLANEPFTIHGYELYISTSIGITFFPEEGNDKLILLENAQTALYQAKKEGKNNYQLSSYLTDISSYKKYVLDRDMRQAINNEEFELYFQPQVEPNSGLICGAEALIRWNHKEWGLISPGEFIPLAEENHLINTITDWVISKVCSFIQEWREKGYDICPVSINIPPIRFIKKGLLDFVKKQLELYEVPPNYLEFEITESTILKSEKNVIATIEGLKNLGVKIAIDDYGTGYASLESMCKFKPNTIKIDQTFIRNIEENSFEKGIVLSTLYLGKTLGIKVVAEGVEEHEQLNFLKQNECDVIQGYIYSEPVRIGKFEKYIESGFINPKKKSKNLFLVERRKFYRFSFPFPVAGEMTIIELNEQKVKVGTSPILIENIGLGGIRILSRLKLPVNSNIKLSYRFQILHSEFDLTGYIKWFEEISPELFTYGVSFEMNRTTEDKLASIVNKLSAYKKKNEKIPGTNFIYEDAKNYLQKKFNSI